MQCFLHNHLSPNFFLANQGSGVQQNSVSGSGDGDKGQFPLMELVGYCISGRLTARFGLRPGQDGRHRCFMSVPGSFDSADVR